MAVVSKKQLLESGVHFGHAPRRWNPKMAPYIFTARQGTHIIDLKKTADQIEIAYKALKDICAEGGRVLFVGTKKQAQEAVKEEAIRSGQFYVDHRWLGGTLTNFKTINGRIRLLHKLYKDEADGIWAKLPKKEVSELTKKRDRLERFLGGIKEMKDLPQALFVVDPRTEEIAVLEARRLNIPVFGIVDTNCDPDLVDYVIPANDDAIRAVKLVTWVMSNAVIEANGGEVPVFEDESFEETLKQNRKDRPETSKPREEKPFKKPAPKKEEVKAEAPKKAEVVKEEKPVKKEEAKVEAPKKAAPKKAEVAKETPVKKTTKKSDAEVVVVDVKKTAKKETIKKVNTSNLEDLTLVELKAKAKESGLKGYSSLKKAELIKLLESTK